MKQLKLKKLCAVSAFALTQIGFSYEITQEEVYNVPKGVGPDFILLNRNWVFSALDMAESITLNHKVFKHNGTFSLDTETSQALTGNILNRYEGVLYRLKESVPERVVPFLPHSPQMRYADYLASRSGCFMDYEKWRHQVKEVGYFYVITAKQKNVSYLGAIDEENVIPYGCYKITLAKEPLTSECKRTQKEEIAYQDKLIYQSDESTALDDKYNLGYIIDQSLYKLHHLKDKNGNPVVYKGVFATLVTDLDETKVHKCIGGFYNSEKNKIFKFNEDLVTKLHELN